MESLTMTLQLLRRNWTCFNPPQPAKTSDALRFGLLGASNIANMAVIIPAKSHPEIIIAAIAARDEEKAKAYAKKYNIPIVHKTYQDLIDDPAIDVIYNPLPNGLHFEWALKALKAGKHVLLEKPSTSNAAEAKLLFHHEILKQPNAPVLLEAFHSRFHPAWQTFVKLLIPENISTVTSSQHMFRGMFPKDDIRFNYALSGGTLMDFGTYPIAHVRDIMRQEPEECLSAEPRIMPKGFDQDCDEKMKAKWRFPNGAIAEIEADLQSTGGYPLAWLTSRLPSGSIPKSQVVHKEVLIEDKDVYAPQQHFVQKTVTFWNYILPTFWHRIDIQNVHTIRSAEPGKEKVIRSWTVTEHKKVYAPERGVGEDYWTSYRYELEEFVNRIRGREGSGIWVDGEDSIKQMQMIDSAYTKAGMKLRPSSTYR